MKLEPMEHGKPLYHEALNRNVEGLNREKAERTDVIPGVGTVVLTNTKRYPFNNSEATIVLEEPRDTLDYTVQTEIVSSTGQAGDVVVYDKQVNGFKIAFTGSATQSTVKYYVTGGFEE